MSDTTAVLPTGPEPETGGRKRRTGLIAGGAAAALVIGGGAFAGYHLLAAHGPAPEEALPASTVAVVSVDLDPSAGQKVAAFRTLRKFPGLRKELGLKDSDDLRKVVFDKLQQSGECKGVSYADDVEPWLGKRAALGAVDLGGKYPSPVFAVQVSDQQKAQAGVRELVKSCGPGSDFGYTVTPDFLIASDSTAHARAIAAAGEKHSLSDDKTYQKWSGEVGDAGVVNAYVAPKALAYLTHQLEGRVPPGMTDNSANAASEILKHFQGGAGTLRFGDGGLELAAVVGTSSKYLSTRHIGGLVGSLPSDTALALGFGVPEDYAKTVVDTLRTSLGADVVDAQLAQLQAQAGLKVPEDLQTLLGDGLALALGGKAPASLRDVTNPAEVPAGVVVQGDVPKMRTVLDTIQQSTGMRLSSVGIATRDNGKELALATSDGYANSLLKGGSLGKQDRFTSVVPDADKASGIMYVDFDSQWVDRLLGLAKDAGAPAAFADNVTPLKALGLSSWGDGDVSHLLLKVSTD